MHVPPRPRHAILPRLLVSGIVAATVSATVVAGCQRSSEPAAPRPDSAPAQATSHELGPAFDLAPVLRRLHLQFERTESGFAGGHSTYSALVSDSGAIELRALRSAEPAEHRAEARAPGAPLRLTTTQLRRDRSTTRASQAVPADGAVQVPRGLGVEELRNTEEGLEQVWRFAARPVGAGPLRVHVRAEGLEFVGETQHGLHFADANSLGFRYGHATWIDANGRRVAVPARFERGEIVLQVPADVVDAAAYPAVLDPVIAPELAVDAPVLGAAPSAFNPAVGWNGTEWLVAWYDSRGLKSGIYAARFSPSGALLDPSGITVAQGTTSVSQPSVASDGTDFLVAWQEYASTYKVRAARVSAAGAVLHATPIDVSGNSYYDDESPAVAFDGTNYLIVWAHQLSSGGQISGARVSAAGVVLDTTAKLIARASSSYGHILTTPAVAFDGANYLVAWQDYRTGVWQIYGTRVSTAGASLDGNGIPLATSPNGQYAPAVAFDGANHLVAWSEWVDSTTTWIAAARVSPAGAVLGTLTVADPPGKQTEVAAAFDGTNVVVAWSDYRGSINGSNEADVYAARVSPAGAVIDATSLPIAVGPGWQGWPALARGGSGALVAFCSSPVAGSSLAATRIDAALSPLDAPAVAVSQSMNKETTPAAATDGTNFLVVWGDTREGGQRIYGARVTPTGTVLDAAAFPISAAGHSSNPSVAFDGANYLVVWDRTAPTPGIAARRVSPGGVVLDAADIEISASGFGSSVAYGAGVYLVAWSHYPTTSTPSDIAGARVSPAGAVLDTTPLAIATAPDTQHAPAVASNGTNFLVAWTSLGTGKGIYAARVDPSGTRPDPATGFCVKSKPGASQAAPTVGSDGADYVVAWEESSTYGVHGIRVSARGTLLDPSDLVLASGSLISSRTRPKVAFNGTNYQLTWTSVGRSSSSYTVNSLSGYLGSYTRGLVQRSASVLASGPVDQYLNWTVSVAADASGHAIAAYTATASPAGYVIDRVRARIATERQLGEACAKASDCASWQCVSGVCCDSECGAGLDRCMACSVLAGAARDGTCGPVVDGTACPAGVCAAGLCVSPPDAGPVDAGEGVDAGEDASVPGTDAGRDAGVAPGPDAAVALDASVPVDAGEGLDAGRDAGAADAALPDAAVSDAGSAADAAMPTDAGVGVDAAGLDAAVPDAAVAPDAARPDAGRADAAVVEEPDASEPPDAEAGPDAALDAGEAEAGAPADSGCGCSSGSGGAAPLWLFAVGALGTIRRRHRSTVR